MTDLNKDGIVTEKEIELQQKLEKMEQQGKMSWWAFFFIIFFGILAFLSLFFGFNIGPVNEIVITIILTLGGIIAAFFGVSGFVVKK